MGLNMNRSLLLENSNLQFKIPSYSKCYNTPVFTEGYMLTKISEYNVSILESMDNIDLITVSGSSNESAVNAVNELAENLDNVINKTRDLKNLLIEMKDQAVESILKEDPNDKLLEGIDSYEMDKVLDECSRNKSTGLRISNITSLNEELLGDFPKINEAASTLSKVMNESITEVLPKVDFYNKNLNNEEGFSEGLNSLSDNLLDSILTEVFGKYSYDKSGLMGSVIETSMDAFGYNSRKERLFSTALYNAACRNLNARQEAADSLNKYMDSVSKSLNEMIVDMASMRKAIIESEKKIPNDYSKSVNENVVGFIVGLKNKVGDIINGVKNTVDPTAKLAVNKINRVNQVYNPDPAYGDSAKLKQLAALLAKQTLANIAAQHQANMNKSLFLKTTDECGNVDRPISGLQAAQECFEMMDEIEGMFAVYEEMAAEYSRANLLSLMEAEGDQPNNISRDPGVKTEQIAENIQRWIDLIAKSIERFTARVAAVITLPKELADWKANRESLSKLTKEGFGNTTVNEWFDFVLTNFDKTMVSNFDINQQIYSSDKALEKHILGIFDGTHKTTLEEGGDFNKNLRKCFYNEYTKTDGGVYARDVVDPASVFAFMDDLCSKGWNGKSLGSVKTDWEELQRQQKNIKTNINSLVENYKANNVANSAEASAAKEEPVQSTNNSATIDDGFERFSLAECFALSNRGGLLSLNEANDGQQPATGGNTNATAQGGSSTPTAPANTTGDTANDVKIGKTQVNGDPNSKNAAINNTIGTDNKTAVNRIVNDYIKINGKAITIKSTMLFAAYKQYITLYKEYYKAKNNK